MMQGLAVERAFLAGEPLGIAQAALDEAVEYARNRRQFGQRIGDFQLIQAMLADMYTELEAARWLVYRTAHVVEEAASRGIRSNKEAAAAILYSAEMSSRVADKAVQIHGGYGYMSESRVARYVRDAKLLEIGGGDVGDSSDVDWSGVGGSGVVVTSPPLPPPSSDPFSLLVPSPSGRGLG